MVTVEDVLVGDNSVVVKTDELLFEFEKLGSSSVSPESPEVPDEVKSALQDNGFEITTQFPRTVTLYAHDEPTPHQKQEVANELGMSETSDLVRAICSVKDEIELTVQINKNGEWEVTHAFGSELKEPHSY